MLRTHFEDEGKNIFVHQEGRIILSAFVKKKNSNKQMRSVVLTKVGRCLDGDEESDGAEDASNLHSSLLKQTELPSDERPVKQRQELERK